MVPSLNWMFLGPCKQNQTLFSQLSKIPPQTTITMRKNENISFLSQALAGELKTLFAIAASHPFSFALPSPCPQQEKRIPANIKAELQRLGESSFLPRKLLFGTSSPAQKRGGNESVFKAHCQQPWALGDDTLMKTQINSM